MDTKERSRGRRSVEVDGGEGKRAGFEWVSSNKCGRQMIMAASSTEEGKKKRERQADEDKTPEVEGR